MNKKLIVALALVATFAFTGSASAVTIAELQAQIAALTAQLAALSGTTVTSTANVPMITSNLTIGSTGSEVSALQQYLIDGGYMNWDGALGYFGSITKSAVSAWQAANGVSPASGYFGPISRAAMNSMTTTTTTTTTTTGTTVVSDGTDGSVTVTLSPAVSLSQTLKKGDTKDIYAVRLQATGGNVAVNRLDVHFNVPPWLLFSQLTIKDNNGNVIATKSMTSAADATEITVNSNYMVRFDGLNSVVTPGTDATLKIGASVLAAGDKIGASGYTPVYVTVPTNGIRIINGKGYTDSVGTSATLPASGTDVNTLTFTSTGNTADIIVSLSPSSPTTRYEGISSTIETANRTLGVFRLRSQNQGSRVNSLSFNLATNPALGDGISSTFSNLQLSDGTNTYGASSISTASPSVVAFTNLNLLLAQDVSKDLTLTATIAASSSNVSASTTLDASTINATDSNYNVATIGGAAMASATSDATAADVTFSANPITVSNISSSLSYVDNGTAAAVQATGKYNFTLVNNGVNNLFVSKVIGVMLSTSTVPASNASSTINYLNPVVAISGDTTGAYLIPAGSSRSFSFEGAIKKSLNSSTSEALNVTAINYGTTAAAPTGASITFGLESLTNRAVFTAS